ncbi:MAG: DUF4234 domain-containing protein [Planctomycetota bacterium]|nr:DUF4234 domain-containing protein [Planctomycetota bacterium]
MVYCPGCGEQASKNATFCDYCGGDLPQGQPRLEESPGDAPSRSSARAEEKASSPYSGERFSYSGSRSDRAGPAGVRPLPESAGRLKIWRAVLLSILTFGFYLFFWKCHQMKVLNSWLGRQEHSFWKWLLLSLLSCGLYTLYHEYKTGRDINEIQRRMGWPENRGLGILSVFMTLLGAGLLAIVLQQDEINKFYRQPLTGHKRPRLKFK